MSHMMTKVETTTSISDRNSSGGDRTLAKHLWGSETLKIGQDSPACFKAPVHRI